MKNAAVRLLAAAFSLLRVNIYKMNSKEKFMHLKKLIEEHPNAWQKLLKKDLSMMKWIDDQLPMLDGEAIQLKTKANWIVNGRLTFPTCPTCKSSDRYLKKNVISLKLGYPKHCCLKCASSDPKTMKKINCTCMKHHGTRWAMQSREVQWKSRKTCLSKYGTSNVSKNEDVKWKKLDTTRKNFGNSNLYNRKKAAQTFRGHSKETKAEIQEKLRRTNLKNLGVEYPTQSHEVMCKQRSSLTYDRKFFKSSWELAKYIYHQDRHDDFKYQPDIAIPYYDQNGKMHIYHPDFIVNGEIQEVKGDQFFDKDGNMTLPYRKKTWNDARWQQECLKYEAKQQCMLENNVKILRRVDVQIYLDYVAETYGNGFLKNLKKKE